LDIEDDESIEKLAQFLKDTYGGLDVLVNSAGTVVDVDVIILSNLNFKLNVSKFFCT
jgi:short-subunit dehydrogenase involved in D-alanine esterification of teichoic acids